jgi:hypothetical protein
LPDPLLGLLQRFGEADLPNSGDLWRSLLADYPEMVNELALAVLLRDGARAFDPASPFVAALRQASPPVAAGRAVIAAALDEVAAQWPRDRPLRIRELGTTRLCDRLHRSGISVVHVGEDEPCDLAVCVEGGALDAALHRVMLAPGGALFAIMPLPNPLWELIFDRMPDWRVELAAAGFIDIGATSVALGPWPCEVIWARTPTNKEEALPVATLSLGLIATDADADLASGLEALGHRVALSETGAMPSFWRLAARVIR